MMTREQFTQTLTSFLRRRPFQPFTVVLADGERLEIDNPEAVGHSGNGSAGFIDPDKEVYFFDFSNVRAFLPGVTEAEV
jgi:hypothetical protein